MTFNPNKIANVLWSLPKIELATFCLRGGSDSNKLHKTILLITRIIKKYNAYKIVTMKNKIMNKQYYLLSGAQIMKK